MTGTTLEQSGTTLKDHVRKQYGDAALRVTTGETAGSCCGTSGVVGRPLQRGTPSPPISTTNNRRQAFPPRLFSHHSAAAILLRWRS